MNNIIDLSTAAKQLITRTDMRQKHGAHVDALLKFCKPKKVLKRRKSVKEVING